MTDEELVERLWQYFGDHAMTELDLIDVVRAATGTDPVTARERVHSLVGTALICYPPQANPSGEGGTELPVRAQDTYRFAR
jgi:hypothetical protein